MHVIVALFAVAQAQNPLPASIKSWTVSSTPVVAIGSETDPHAQFKSVSAIRTPSGDIIVQDGAASELRVFSASGAYVRTIGRRGSGPGEFERTGLMFAAADTVFIAERRRLVQAFTAQAGYLGQQRVAPVNAPRGVLLLSRLTNGSYLVEEGGGFVALPPNLPAGELSRDTTKLGVVTKPDSGMVTWIGAFPRTVLFSFAWPAFDNRVSLTPVAMAPGLVRETSGDRVWIGDSGAPTITLYDARAIRVGQATLPLKARRLDAAAVDRVRDRLIEITQTDRKPTVAASYAREARPENAPYYLSFIAGIDGEMWVELFREDTARPARYVVCNRSGQLVGQILFPSRFRPTHIGADYVLGVQRDDDDVESVVMLKLNR